MEKDVFLAFWISCYVVQSYNIIFLFALWENSNFAVFRQYDKSSLRSLQEDLELGDTPSEFYFLIDITLLNVFQIYCFYSKTNIFNLSYKRNLPLILVIILQIPLLWNRHTRDQSILPVCLFRQRTDKVRILFNIITITPSCYEN